MTEASNKELENDIRTEPWVELQERIDRGDLAALLEYLDTSTTGEKARAISRLPPDKQRQLLGLLPEQRTAELMEEVPDAQAVQLLAELPAPEIAAIVDHLPSDEQADLIRRFDRGRADEILSEMEPVESADARQLRVYPDNSAGGLMVTEFLTCPATAKVGEVIGNLRDQLDVYEDYDVQYLYVIAGERQLVGVLPLRQLVLSRIEQSVDELMVRDPLHLPVDTPLEEIDAFFQSNAFFGVPITGEQGRLLGVVRRSDVVEARAERADESLRRFSGLIGGEEFRSMPLYSRSLRRMIWLSLTVMLNLVSASIIGLYQDTLNQTIALAMFLPVISGMGGSSGNQAIAVSMRELTLGLIKPYEITWVMLKELSIGLINGLLLGTAIGITAWLWKGNFYLGIVVGVAMAFSTLIAVCLGGALPLVLKRFRIDPALVAGPILMTLADACGFFFALSFANFLSEQLKM